MNIENISKSEWTEQNNSLSVRVYLLIGSIALLLAATVGYATYMGSRSVSVIYPLVNAVHEIRLESALGHLWAEEALLSDPHLNIDDVWRHYDLAEWYIDAMINGGTDESGTLSPINDNTLRALLTETKEKLLVCRSLIRERFSVPVRSGVGSEIDQKYDAAFNDLLNTAVKVETTLKKIIDRNTNMFHALQSVMLGLSLLLSVLVGFIIFRFDRKRGSDMELIRTKNMQLDALNQQLSASEQQLKAANQQLFASEQQMRASNQQMMASEQQLRAANQQLLAAQDALQTSEQRYRTLFSGMAEGVALHRLVYDDSGTAVNYEILSVNSQYEAILNLSGEQVTGRLATEAYGTAQPPFLEEFVRVSESGIPIRFETYFAPMGRYFDISASPFEPGGFATIFSDITERKQAEEKLRLNEARLSILWEISQYRSENVQDLLDFALEKAILLTGSKIGYIYHYSEQKQEFILNSWSKDVMKECSVTNPETVYSLDKTGIWGEAVRQRHPIIVNDFESPNALKKGYPKGHAHLHNFMTVPLFSGKNIIAVVGLANKNSDYDQSDIMQITLLMDSVWKIIDKNQAQGDLEQLELRTQKLESLGILAGGIAHDFNNLLTAIMGNISLAKMKLPKDSRISDMLEEAEKASERAKALTQQLLTFSRGGSPLKETVSIAEIIRESAGFALRGSNTALELSGIESLWHVDVDPGQMNQVFHNLILNALHAMPGGGVISVHCENMNIDGMGDIRILKPGRYIKISVKDSGTGIADDILARIFDPYFTTKQQGSGLGLASVYSIITKHNGHITVESEVGIGTTFHIYLPASENRASSGNTAQYLHTDSGAGKVLVMDDEETIRNVAGEILRNFGYEVDYAGDGAEALRIYRDALAGDKPFDLVIMDLTVPGGMGGMELIRRLMSIDPKVRAIVSSGYSNDPVMADYHKHGFRAFISKPYTVAALKDVVNKVLAAS